MTFRHDGETHSVFLMDDGTLDTVIQVDGRAVRFSQERGADVRREDGSMTRAGLLELAREAIDLGLADEDGEEA